MGAKEDATERAPSFETTKTIDMYNTGAILRSLGLGDPSAVITNNMYGMEHTGYSYPLPPSMSRTGFVFLTRPQLNMTKWNLRRSRSFMNLLNRNEKSIASWIRNTLDPRLGRRMPTSLKKEQKLVGEQYEFHPCPLVDERYGFIPLFTNSVTKMSGLPDKITGKFVSEPNLYKSVYQQVDSSSNLREPVTLDFTARNTLGDPLMHLLDVWADYSMAVFDGTLDPYFDMCVLNEKDYETRVFRIVLDETGRFVEHIVAAYPGFSEGMNISNFFTFDREKTFVEGNNEIQFRLSVPGVEYNDPVLVYEFNKIVTTFNDDMVPKRRDRLMKKLIIGTNRNSDNFRAYPYIDPEDLEFSWWTYK